MPYRGSECPHPEKLRWPLVDAGGPRCPCGCVWEPYIYACERNRIIEAAREDMRLEVYRCAAWGTREPLDHYHLTDARKRERLDPRRRLRGELDDRDKAAILSVPAIQPEEEQRRTWSGHRRARPISDRDRERLHRHRRS